MTTLFPDLTPELHHVFPLNKPLTAGVCGRGPAGETCGSCAHLCRTGNTKSRTYLKCGLMRHHWTHGPGTDIRAGWQACEHWKAEEPKS